MSKHISKKEQLKDCPVCFNSSGFNSFNGNASQACEDCEGDGLVTETKFKRLVKKYGDLICT